MIFKDIVGYENRYVVNEKGQIYSLYDFAGRKQFKEKKQCTDKYGYKYICLYKNGKHKHLTIHRAVAIAFIDNINNYPQVNHIDGDKTNNSVSNLEWCNASQNVQHAYDIGLNKPHKSPWKNCESGNHPKAKKVLAIKNNEKIIFPSAIDMCKFLNTSKSAVATAIKRNNKCKGWIVKWINEY